MHFVCLAVKPKVNLTIKPETVCYKVQVTSSNLCQKTNLWMTVISAEITPV